MPIQEILQDYINMYDGALPEHIIAAMIALFGLEDDDAEQLNGALLHQAGEAVTELLPEEGSLNN